MSTEEKIIELEEKIMQVKFQDAKQRYEKYENKVFVRFIGFCELVYTHEITIEEGLKPKPYISLNNTTYNQDGFHKYIRSIDNCDDFNIVRIGYDNKEELYLGGFKCIEVTKKEEQVINNLIRLQEKKQKELNVLLKTTSKQIKQIELENDRTRD
jgi:hypothetical protein